VPQTLLFSEAHATQVFPLQHPLGQEFASQTHWPLVVLHSVPAGQASHVAPPAPQEPLVSLATSSQLVPLQHPLQVPPPQLQTPVLHVSPIPHAVQAAPAVPHWPVPCEA
jgi:hypothetical protein